MIPRQSSHEYKFDVWSKWLAWMLFGFIVLVGVSRSSSMHFTGGQYVEALKLSMLILVGGFLLVRLKAVQYRIRSAPFGGWWRFLAGCVLVTPAAALLMLSIAAAARWIEFEI